MQAAPREKAVTKKDDSPPKPKPISIGKEDTEETVTKGGNDSMVLKDPHSDECEDIQGGSEGLAEAESLDTNSSDLKLRDNAARYAALRNHRIRFEDAIDPNAERVKTLSKNDVIFGRGRGYQNHPGNLRMRTIIDKYKNDYHSLKRQGKRDMVEKVYKEIVEGGARFLKKVEDEDEWVKVDVPIALQKVSHTLRCRKKSGAEMAETASASLPPWPSSLTHLHAQGLDVTPSLSADQLSRASLGMLQDRSSMLNGALTSANPYIELEAQRLAALQNRVALSGLPSIQSLMQPMHSNVDYYNMLRRDQLLRETMALQQIAGQQQQQQQQQAATTMGNNAHHLQQLNTASFPSLPQGNIYDQLQLLQRSAQNDQAYGSNMGQSGQNHFSDQT